MFNLTKNQVRIFFIKAWEKYKLKASITPLEDVAINWIIRHPEYHRDLENKSILSIGYNLNEIYKNPFLHLSMHLAISEQLSIDSPPGIQSIYKKIFCRTNDTHQAIHEIMDSLYQVLTEINTPGEIWNNTYISLLKEKI